MDVDKKLLETVENVVSRYIMGYSFAGINAKHLFQPHAKPKQLVDALVKEISENLSYKTIIPQFDVMAPGQEELVIQFCTEIAGSRGQPCRPPDPVRLLEMAAALYAVEVDG